jgi:hypothetical protein
VINTPPSSKFLKREPSKGLLKLKTSFYESTRPSILSKSVNSFRIPESF